MMAFSLLREVQYLGFYSVWSTDILYLHVCLFSVDILLLLIKFCIRLGLKYATVDRKSSCTSQGCQTQMLSGSIFNTWTKSRADIDIY